MSTQQYLSASYPDHNVPDSVKNEKEFGLKMARYMYGRHYAYRDAYTGWRDSWERN